jgi:hypothetical protein
MSLFNVQIVKEFLRFSLIIIFKKKFVYWPIYRGTFNTGVYRQLEKLFFLEFFHIFWDICETCEIWQILGKQK